MPTSKSNNKTIGITLGDPSGIGPEVVAKALAKLSRRPSAQFKMIGEENIFYKYAKKLPAHCSFINIEKSRSAAPMALASLQKAVELLKKKKHRRPRNGSSV